MSTIAKIKYDVEDVEAGKEYEQAKPGIYPAKIIEAEHRNSDGKNDIHVIVEITDPADTYSRLHSYVHLGEASRWKMRELTDATGLPAKGTLDTDKLVNKNIRIKVGAGTYEGEYRAQLNRFLSISDDDEEEEDEEGEASADVGDESEVTENYDEWDVDDLKAELEEREIDIPTGRGAALKRKLIEALEEDDDLKDGDADEEEEEEEEELPDFASLSLGELKKLAADAGLEVKGPKSKYVAALEEHHGDSEDEPEFEDDYDEWTAEELIGEAKERELELPKGRKDKAKLIALLREDDASEPF